MIKDLTKGNEKKVLFTFCMPLLISCIIQQLYNIVDGVVVGRYASPDPLVCENALAAVLNATSVTMVFLAVATGANIGASVLISQLFGARQNGKIKTTVSTALISMISLGAVLAVTGYIFSDSILKLLDTPGEIFDESLLYLRIYIYSIIFVFIYNTAAGVFTALGDSKTPLYLLIFSSGLNILLDLYFVISLGLGVGGAAWATFISQALAAVVALLLLIKRMRLFPAEGKFELFSFPLLKRISRLAVPSMLQQSFVSVGNMFIQGKANEFDTASIAGFGSALKLNAFAVMAYMTVSNGISSFTAQNYGAGNNKRVQNGVKAGAMLLAVLVVPVFIAFFFFPEPMINIFLTENSSKAIQVGAEFLKWVAPFYFVISVKIVFDGVFRGTGRMGYFMTATLVDLIIRVALSYVLADIYGIIGIGYAWSIGWCVAAVMASVFYIIVYKKVLQRE